MMKRYTIAAAIMGLVAGAAVWVRAETPGTREAGGPTVGQPAPEIALLGSDGKAHSLRSHKGQPVVLAFYPKAFTGG
jgi:hypothetical protein